MSTAAWACFLALIAYLLPATVRRFRDEPTIEQHVNTALTTPTYDWVEELQAEGAAERFLANLAAGHMPPVELVDPFAGDLNLAGLPLLDAAELQVIETPDQIEWIR